jgi:pyridoxine 5-phosphate synthase
MKKQIRLGVNIDHVATLRQVRAGQVQYPNLLRAAQMIVKAGADQITIHLREDRRHIQDADLQLLAKARMATLNLEMGVTDEMIGIALKSRPDYVCWVPEKRRELTTEGGLDLFKSPKRFFKASEIFQKKGIKISPFIEPSLKQVQRAKELGSTAVEFHTGHWVLLTGAKKTKAWQKLVEASNEANSLGLQVHAGHGLDYEHASKIKELPFLEEVNIGHFLVCEAVFVGFPTAIKEMIKRLNT